MDPIEYLIPPWEHQRKAIEFSSQEKNLALFFDPGTGKTATAINILRLHCREKKKVVSTLIVAPIVVLNQWKREFAMHSKLPQTQIFVCYADGAKRLKQIQEAISSTKGECIIITNYETLLMDKCFVEFLNWKPEVLILDESHRCKSPSAKRTKKVTQLSDRAQYKYLLTGTPMTNSAMDIFSQFRILDGGQTFGDNFFAFRTVWFEDINASWKSRGNYFPKWELKSHKVHEMNRLIYKKAMRATKSECLDLPPFVRIKVEVEMSMEQRKLYEEMRKHFITFIDSDRGDMPQAVVAQQAVTKALRMQQIITGFVKTEAGDIRRIKENPRLNALSELLEDLTIANKVIVWCHFKENYAQVRDACKALKLEYAELHGETSDREGNIQAFRENPNVKVLIANQGAGGVGVNLIEASYSIYFSKTFSLEHDIQSEARNYRGGSEIHQKITRIDLVATGTIDELITQALEKKQDLISNIIELRKQLDLELS